jgi:hypothetical protein
MASIPSSVAQQVLELCYDAVAKLPDPRVIDASLLVERGKSTGLTEQQIYEGLQELQRRQYIGIYTFHHGKIRHFVIQHND